MLYIAPVYHSVSKTDDSTNDELSTTAETVVSSQRTLTAMD